VKSHPPIAPLIEFPSLDRRERSLFTPGRRLVTIVAGSLFLAAVAGCSRQSSLDRHLKRGYEFFEQEKYEEATIEYLNVLRIDGTNSVAILNSGLAHYRRGEPVRALPFLFAAKEQDPDNIQVKLNLGRIFRAGNELEVARTEAAEVLNLDPDNFRALVLLADCSVEVEEVRDAISVLGKNEKLFSDRAPFHLALGHLLFKQKKNELAGEAFDRAGSLDPENPAVLEALGNFYALIGKLDRAETYLSSAAEKAAAGAGPQVRYARFKYAMGKKHEAKELLEEIVQAKPDSVQAWQLLGELALLEGAFEDCQKAVDKIQQAEAGNFEGRQLLARLLLLKGETAKSIEVFENLNERYPYAPAISKQLAIAYLKDGRIAEAKGALDKTLSLNPRDAAAQIQRARIDLSLRAADSAIERLTELLEENPENTQAMILLIRAYLSGEDKDPKAAIETCRLLADLLPGKHSGPYLLGRLYRRLDKMEEARTAFQESLRIEPNFFLKEAQAAFKNALEIAPNFLPALSGLCAVEVELGVEDLAAARVLEAIAERPEQPGLHYLLGTIYADQEKDVEAEAALRKEIEIEPRQEGSYLALAQLLYKKKRLDQALKEVEEVLEVNPDLQSALMMAGMFYEQLKDNVAALDRYERILKLNPNFVGAANNAAYLFGETPGKLDRAFELAKHARKLKPDDPFIADTLGWIAYKHGDYVWALTLIQEAAEAFPEHPEIQYHLAATHLALGDEEESAKALATALEHAEEDWSRAAWARLVTELLARPIEEVTDTDVPLVAHALAEDPVNPAALVRQVVLHEKAGQWDQAKTICGRLLESNGDFLWPLLRMIKYEEKDSGDLSRAFELAQQARTLAPDDPEVAHVAGWLAYREGEHDWAFGLLRQSGEARPRDAEVQYHFSLASFTQGQIDRAQEIAEAASRIESSSPVPAAAEDFRKILQAIKSSTADPEVVRLAEAMPESDPRYTAARIVIALQLESDGKVGNAVQILESIFETSPRIAQVAKEAARLYANHLDNDQRAYELASKARALLPEDPDVSFLLGKVAYGRKEFDWAGQLLEETITRRPGDSEAIYLLGFCRAGQNNAPQAEELLKKALKLDPDSNYAAEAKQLLSQK